MGLSEQNVTVTMVRADLDDIPQYPLPPDFSVRWFEDGDESLWKHIQSESEPHFEITPGLFIDEFGSFSSELRERLFFLYDSRSRPIGTATAWFDNDYEGLPYGRIHWVALIPAMQGKGLSKPLMTVACNRLRELGHVQAYLTTSTGRVPALRLYSTFGFVPKIKNAQDTLIWDQLERELGKSFRDSRET